MPNRMWTLVIDESGASHDGSDRFLLAGVLIDRYALLASDPWRPRLEQGYGWLPWPWHVNRLVHRTMLVLCWAKYASSQERERNAAFGDAVAAAAAHWTHVAPAEYALAQWAVDAGREPSIDALKTLDHVLDHLEKRHFLELRDVHARYLEHVAGVMAQSASGTTPNGQPLRLTFIAAESNPGTALVDDDGRKRYLRLYRTMIRRIADVLLRMGDTRHLVSPEPLRIRLERGVYVTSEELDRQGERALRAGGSRRRHARVFLQQAVVRDWEEGSGADVVADWSAFRARRALKEEPPLSLDGVIRWLRKRGIAQCTHEALPLIATFGPAGLRIEARRRRELAEQVGQAPLWAAEQADIWVEVMP